MKVLFSIRNRFASGLNLVIRRNQASRFFSSFNLALAPLSSSEDETFVCEDLAPVPTIKSNCVSGERIGEHYAARNCITRELRCRACSFKQEELDDEELGVVKMILEEKGLCFGEQDCGEIDLDEGNVISALIVLYHEGGSAALSLCFFRWLEFSLGFKNTVRTVCVLVRILVLANMNYRAVDLLKCIICGYPQHIEPDELFKLLQDVCAERVLETMSSMLVRCYTSENMIHEAVEVICNMKEVGLFPSATTCDSLIKCLFELDLTELAWDLLEEMQGRRLVNSATITLFTDYYNREGNIESGWKLLMSMKNFGIKPDVILYSSFVHLLSSLSYVKEAASLIFKMIEVGILPDTVLLTSVIDGYCKVGRLEDALRIINLFQAEPDIVLYNTFISALSEDGNMEQASAILQEMLDLGFLPDCFSYTAIIGGYCRTNNIRKAHQYLGRMLKDGIKPSADTYTVLISSYCQMGDVEIAHYLLQRLTTMGLVPDVVVYNTLINGYKNIGQLHKMFEMLDMMKCVGISPDIVTYNTLIYCLTVMGYVSEANNLLDEVIARGIVPDVVTFTNVINGYSNKGLFEDAFRLWSYMKENDVKPDVITYNALINGYCKSSRMDEAFALFRKMLETGLVPDVILYNTLIHGYCRIGDIEEACQLINLMAENNIIPNDVTYKALVLGYVKRRATNPMENAANKLLLILQRHDLAVEIDPSYYSRLGMESEVIKRTSRLLGS